MGKHIDKESKHSKKDKKDKKDKKQKKSKREEEQIPISEQNKNDSEIEQQDIVIESAAVENADYDLSSLGSDDGAGETNKFLADRKSK